MIKSNLDGISLDSEMYGLKRKSISTYTLYKVSLITLLLVLNYKNGRWWFVKILLRDTGMALVELQLARSILILIERNSHFALQVTLKFIPKSMIEKNKLIKKNLFSSDIFVWCLGYLLNRMFLIWHSECFSWMFHICWESAGIFWLNMVHFYYKTLFLHVKVQESTISQQSKT